MTFTTRTLTGSLAAILVGTLLLTVTPHADATAPSRAEDRHIVPHVVRPGETASGLAVRFHAWTAELIALNHLGPAARLYVGQRIRIPVVGPAKPGTRDHATASHTTGRSPGRSPSRAHVRAVVARTAERHGVDPELALAVSWQEAGWQMGHVSSAGAFGAMQVIKDTGRWMEIYAGRPLHLRHLRDNVTAGVLLLKVLAQMTRGRGDLIASYYQGVGAVREDGWYDDTHRYVANVRAIKHRLERGLPPG
ncbi:lytic transglycosylase domain-containing protein [Nocardioides sp.]|uniref:lytic transglycosylase domain-containing protein n=1 Tax=Nocardioides sp. TaxID=35761 RepID=UPI003D0E7A68